MQALSFLHFVLFLFLFSIFAPRHKRISTISRAHHDLRNCMRELLLGNTTEGKFKGRFRRILLYLGPYSRLSDQGFFSKICFILFDDFEDEQV